jgi:hypothetical protein
MLLQGLNEIKNPRLFWDRRTGLLYIPGLRRLTVCNMNTKEISHMENMQHIETFRLHSRLGLLAVGNEGIFRIDRFNRRKINQHIDDLTAADGASSGTRFTVEVPLDFAYIN